MESNEVEIKKKRTRKVVLFSLGTLVLGTLTFFGIKHFKKTKNENTNEDNLENNTVLDTQNDIQNNSTHHTNPSVPDIHAPAAFPLKLGSKGDNVRKLQQALIRTYGATILKKFGADGGFGTELDSALKIKGYAVPLQEVDFLKITSEKKEEPKKYPAPLKSFDPAAIAKGIYYALVSRDFNAAIILLKSIKNTTDYSLVNEQLKRYRIAGIRQTLVNGMLNTFTENSQKIKVQDTLKSIGLKYDGKKWTLS